MKGKIQYVTARDIIIRSKLPDTDYVVNPYLGCSFGCSYCYASFMGRRVGESANNWGNFVYVKENALPIFTTELSSLIRKNGTGTILFSSVTDPYQPIEADLLLTRKMLEMCMSTRYEGKISILTKSPLVIRDIDVISDLQAREVGITITHIDEQPNSLTRKLERNAPAAHGRLRALEKLNRQGISTYAFVGPLLPHLFHEPSELENIFREISLAGTQEVYVEYLNIKPNIRKKILENLDSYSDLYNFYNSLDTKSELCNFQNEIIYELLRKYNLRIRLKKILRHR